MQNTIIELPLNITNVMKSILETLFLPDTENVSTKLNAIKQKFAYTEDFKRAFTDIKEYLFESGNQIPSITVNFGSSRGKYNYGSNAKTLDMAWYSEYKPSVDKIIVAFVYIAFILNVYKRLPDIISGSGAITVNASKISKYGDE